MELNFLNRLIFRYVLEQDYDKYFWINIFIVMLIINFILIWYKYYKYVQVQ